MNISAGEGLQDVLKSNLGPSGTLKMYVAALKRRWADANLHEYRLVDGSGGVCPILNCWCSGFGI